MPTLTAFGWKDDLNVHSLFEPSKTLVTRFSPARDRSPDAPKIVLFKQHAALCASKASKALVGVGLLAKSWGGLKAKFVRQLVEAVVIPRLTWCAAPHSPLSGSRRTSSRSTCA
ncbi:hypothetical protein AAT19DRAFT_13751 [Rhodotorula toruloides]|uniref:Uncharacterized protein n=1 Tax=Rhodotorula toruloides TaxID=5286 RepID=A0A2T0ACJ3_RHOTO|nr:hypothetical protein AAT19DRAFT_13751 [Rhodotorula toruloides]